MVYGGPSTSHAMPTEPRKAAVNHPLISTKSIASRGLGGAKHLRGLQGVRLLGRGVDSPPLFYANGGRGGGRMGEGWGGGGMGEGFGAGGGGSFEQSAVSRLSGF